MGQINWSKLAISDLESIYDFIGKESTFYAQKTIESIFIRVEVLVSFPESGRNVPEFERKDIRELIEGNYRIFYKISSKNVFILRVHHSSRRIRQRRLRTSQ